MIARIIFLSALLLCQLTTISQRIFEFDSKGELVKYYKGVPEIKDNFPTFYKNNKSTIKSKGTITVLIVGCDASKYRLLTSTRKENCSENVLIDAPSVHSFKQVGTSNKWFTSFSPSDDNKDLAFQIIKGSDFFAQPADFDKFLGETNKKSFVKTNLNLDGSFESHLNSKFTRDNHTQISHLLKKQDALLKLNKRIELSGHNSKESKIKHEKQVDSLKQIILRYNEIIKEYIPPVSTGCCDGSKYVSSLIEAQEALSVLENLVAQNLKMLNLEKLKLVESITVLKEKLEIDKVIPDFLGTHKLNNPLVELLHQGVFSAQVSNTHDYYFSVERLKIDVLNKYNLKGEIINFQKPILNVESKLRTYGSNLDFLTFSDPLYAIELDIDMSKKGTEAELSNSGAVLGLADFNLNTTNPGGIFDNVPYKFNGVFNGASEVETVTGNNSATYSAVYTSGGTPAPIDTIYSTIRTYFNTYEVSIIEATSPGQHNLILKEKGSANSIFSINSVSSSNFTDRTIFENEIMKMITALENGLYFGSKDELIQYNPWSDVTTELNSVAALKYVQEKSNQLVEKLGLNYDFNILNKDRTFYTKLIGSKSGLEALSKPVIALKGRNYKPSAQSYKVLDGAAKLQEYTININNDSKFYSTELPLVRKLYSFSVSTGLLFSNFSEFEYGIVQIPSSSTTQVSVVTERVVSKPKVAPSVFFNFYTGKADVFSKLNRSNWYKRFEVGVGFDYLDKKILDNVYIGGGYSPHRLVHFMAGARFGQTPTLNNSKLDPFTITEASLMAAIENEWNWTPTYFFAINFGLDIIPDAISLFFK